MPIQEKFRVESGTKPCQGSAQAARVASRRLSPCRAAAVVACVLVPGLALAQSAPSAPSTNEPGKPEQLMEIVVTAQHRSERLQDVPLAVTSLSAAALNQQGVSNTSDLAQAMPSLIFTSQLSAANFYIRGVGSALFDPTSESPVAVYVDDVYIANPEANIFTLSGVKQIDVLSGPQGTLFGRNATGGVIQVQTRDPSSQLHLDAAVTYASYDFVSVPIYLTTGVTDNVSTDLSLLYENQGDGYGHNLFNGSPTFQQALHNYSVRNKWLITLPTDTVIRFSADYANLGNSNAFQRTPGSVAMLPGAASPLGYPGRFNNNTNLNDFTHLRTGGVSVKIDQDLSLVNITSISAYRTFRNFNSIDQDQSTVAAIDLTWRTKFHNFSQEIRIKNLHDPVFNWIVGAYYYNATGAYENLAVDGGVIVPYDQQVDKSVAGFAQGTFTLFSDTDITGGIRYTTESEAFSFPAFSINNKQSVNQPTYRMALDHHFSPDILGYVSYNTGFKSGGYDLLAGNDPYKPEKLSATEVGVKTELFDHTLRLNVDGFFYRYTDQQVTIPVIAGDIIVNAAGSHIKGLEANFDYVVGPGFQLSGGVSLMSGHYTDYPGVQPYDPNGVPIGGPTNEVGKTTVQTPHFVGNLSAQYSIPRYVGTFVFDVGVQHNNGYFTAADNLLSQPAYTIANASVSWASNNLAYDVKLWGRNLLDSTYYIFRAPGKFPVGSTQIEASPRTVGVTVSYHF